MNLRSPVLSVLTTLAFTGSATADSKPAAKLDTKKLATTPPAELSSLSKFLVGSWHCAGTSTPAPGIGKPFANKTNVTWTLTLDGFFLASTSEGEKVPGLPLPTVFKGESRVTYDRTTNQFVNMGIGNRGGYTTSTSKGWEGDKWSWSGSTSGLIKTETRATLTKKSDKEYRIVGERMEGGKWVVAGEDTCKKK